MFPGENNVKYHNFSIYEFSNEKFFLIFVIFIN